MTLRITERSSTIIKLLFKDNSFLLLLTVLGTHFKLNHSYWALFPTVLNAFLHYTKALFCETTVRFRVTFYNQVLPKFHSVNAELRLTYLIFWGYIASLCFAGADSMRTQQA